MPVFEISRRVNAPREVAWSVVSDLEGYAGVAANLSKAEVLEGEGVGLKRRCWDSQGREELVGNLGLEDLIVMGQDWGGPIGLSVAASQPVRVSGLVFGNTWFWPTDRFANAMFSRVMSSPPLKWAILRRNFFVERLIPMGTARKLSRQEMDHYRGVQPAPEARKGVAEFPRQLLAARPWLSELSRKVPEALFSKPLLLVWGMKDFAFVPKHFFFPAGARRLPIIPLWSYPTRNTSSRKTRRSRLPPRSASASADSAVRFEWR